MSEHPGQMADGPDRVDPRDSVTGQHQKFLPERIPGTNVPTQAVDQDFVDFTTERMRQAFRALSRLNRGQDRRNAHQRLSAYRVHSEALMVAYRHLFEMNVELVRESKQVNGATPEQAGRRWTDEQDNLLVDMVCQGDSSMVKLALVFNRTPAAISSRLTYLVGVAKVSRHVVGRITGYLDGEAVSGVFDGELRS